jgi:class 3 adenylate cyclase
MQGVKIKSLKNPLGKAQNSQIEVERRVFHLKTLYDVTREIGFLLDTKEIVQNLLMMVIGTFGVFRGFIVVVDTTKGTIEAVTERDIDKTSMEILFQAIESGLFFKEIKKIAGTEILGYKNQKKGKKKKFDLLSSLQIRIWIPFEVNKSLSGVIVLGDKLSGDSYTPDDRELLSALANQGAVAIQNATTHQEVVRYAEELAASLKRIQILESIKSNLAKFVPQTVQDLIEESPEAPLLDKREADVSVLFADITNYTLLSSKLELDQVNRIVERYFGAFLDEIMKNGGDVNETAGDGLMVIFQDPDPHRHARAAVLSALGIQRRTREINAQLKGQLEPITMHVGVNSGIASVGATKIEGAAGTRWTYTASGSTINIASRLAALAEGEGIILSQETKTRIGDGFDLDDLGPLSLKNVSEPIRAFRLTTK